MRRNAALLDLLSSSRNLRLSTWAPSLPPAFPRPFRPTTAWLSELKNTFKYRALRWGGPSTHFVSEAMACSTPDRHRCVELGDFILVLWYVVADQHAACPYAGAATSASGTFLNCFAGPSSHPAFIQRAYERLNPQPHAVSENGKDRQVPPGIRAWGLERFFFSLPDSPSPKLDTALFIPRQVGDRFLRNYFKIVHPYMPILSYAEVMSHWSRLWEVRPTPGPPWTKEIVFTALAIGARVCPTMGQDDLDSADAWAEHFSQAVDIPITAMREPSLQLVHLLLLKVGNAV